MSTSARGCRCARTAARDRLNWGSTRQPRRPNGCTRISRIPRYAGTYRPSRRDSQRIPAEGPRAGAQSPAVVRNSRRSQRDSTSYRRRSLGGGQSLAILPDDHAMARKAVVDLTAATIRSARQATDPSRDPVVMRVIRDVVGKLGLGPETKRATLTERFPQEHAGLVARVERQAFRDVVPRFHTVRRVALRPRSIGRHPPGCASRLPGWMPSKRLIMLSTLWRLALGFASPNNTLLRRTYLKNSKVISAGATYRATGALFFSAEKADASTARGRPT